jgi:hypothetical protein
MFWFALGLVLVLDPVGWVGSAGHWFVVEKTNNGWASCCGIFGLEGL